MSQAGRAWSLTLFLLALCVLAVGAAAASSHEESHVTDPEGDARERHSNMVLSKAGDDGCWTIGPAVDPACNVIDENAAPAENVGGEPAPPAMDAIAAWFDETPTHLIVKMQVASLDPTLAGFVWEDETGLHRGFYGVYWSIEDDPACSGTTGVYMTPFPVDRQVDVESYGTVACEDPGSHPWAGDCNSWAWCMHAVEHEIEYGTPATITWRVPRVVLPHGEKGATLHDPRLAVYRIDEPKVGFVAWSDAHRALDRVSFGGDTGFRYATDVSAPGRSFTFTKPMANAPAQPDRIPPWMDAVGDVEDATIDILSFSIVETPETIELIVELAEILPEPAVGGFEGALGLPDGTVVYFQGYEGYAEKEGQWIGYAHYLLPYTNASPLARPGVVMNPPIVAEPGTPGTVRLTLDRGRLPFIPGGGHTTILTVYTSSGGSVAHYHDHAAPTWPTLDPTVTVSRTDDSAEEDTLHLPVYRFLHDTSAAALAQVFRIEDEAGDAVLPAGASVDGTRPDQFDITYLEARDAVNGTIELTAGIRDLSVVGVPLGFHAVYYAFGLETSAGPFMVGYYKDNDDPAGQFLCASDTTVLAEEPRDPTQAVWTIIDGLVTTSGGHSGGSGSPGSIAFAVPRSCVGFAPEEEAIFTRFAAATFLVQNPTGRNAQGQAHQVDEAKAGSVVSLARAIEAPVASAWYAAPFGIASFWDILGIGVAVALATGAGALKLHQRTRDKRAVAGAKLREDREVYREALAHAIASGTARPGDDPVLQALRRRLGIGEREHAVMLLAARASAGLGTGLAEGERFLDRYRIEKLLGAGGFARTFLARDEKLGRRVVLKVARWDDPREAAQALKEGRALARLQHPGIVAIHDVEEVGGEVVLVLEYMSRGSLADLLAKSRLTPSEALSLTDDVLAALDAAHAKGIVHRDVKPANVLLGEDGRAKLADFGIARRASGDAGTASDLDMGGHGAGTIGYMAPEQARGAPADARSDLYAVGAMLYEMLAGRPYLTLAGLSDYDARTAILEDEPLLPLAGVADAINETLARALAKDPSERPRSASEMRRALAQLQATSA